MVAIKRRVLIALFRSAAFLALKWTQSLMCHHAAVRYFHIGTASIYVVNFLADLLLGGKPE